MAKKPAKKTQKLKPTKREPKEDFNQAAFRAIQETIRKSESKYRTPGVSAPGDPRRKEERLCALTLPVPIRDM
jgi:hypothetical protein